MAYNMNLDDLDRMRAIDVDEMLSHIDALPAQLENAWRLAQTLPLPESHQAPRLIALCGMGGSAIGGDLAAAIVAPTSLTVRRPTQLACPPVAGPRRWSSPAATRQHRRDSRGGGDRPRARSAAAGDHDRRPVGRSRGAPRLPIVAVRLQEPAARSAGLEPGIAARPGRPSEAGP